MVASLMEIFDSPTRVRREFAERFPDRDSQILKIKYCNGARAEALSYWRRSSELEQLHNQVCYEAWVASFCSFTQHTEAIGNLYNILPLKT